MKNELRLSRLLSRLSLTPKLLIITVLAGGVVWGVLERTQSDRLKQITDGQLTRILEQQARENRIRFDNYVMAFHDMAALIVSRTAFRDHLRRETGPPPGTEGVRYRSEIPPWLPDASVMRHFIRINNAILIDGGGRVREVYQRAAAVPPSLLPPSNHLLRMSRGQSMLTVVDGVPYLVASEAAAGPQGADAPVLVLITPIDDEFMAASQGVISGKGIIALVETARLRVIASNDPDRIPAGTPLDALKDSYLITSKAFFDWGGSELLMQFTALVSKDELAEMGRAMLAEGRMQRAVISLTLLAAFLLIMLWIARRIGLLTENIGAFSRTVLDADVRSAGPGGDQIRVLEERFALFKDEIVESRERLKRQADELLREKTVYLDTLLHSSSLVVVAADLDLRIKYFNPVAEAMFGISARDAIGKTLSETRLDTRLGTTCFERILGGADDAEACRFTTRTGPEADQRVLDSTVSIVKDRDGRRSGLLLVAQDITERTLAEERRLELERQLLHGQKLESIGVLAGGVAHDFNNLLMAILGNLHLALLKLPPGSSGRPMLEKAVQASNRAADLTRQLLAYSGKGKFVIRLVDVNAMVKENAFLLTSSVSRTAALDFNLQPDIALIEADEGQIQQVIMNLLINASEAIGENAGVITLSTGELECDDPCLERSRAGGKPPPGRFVYLEVSDTGCGMSAETQRRLFDPFFSTKFTGRGLGMSAVLGIVRGHGGAILIESSEGRGSTLRVLFPAADGRATNGGGPVEREAEAAGKPLQGTALVVDDEAVVRDVCSTMIEHFGMSVLTAVDGGHAVQVFRERQAAIDVVLLDLSMPNMDGLTAMRELLRIKPGIRIILSSGYNEQDAIQRFNGMGLAGFIQKPYDPERLRRALEEALRGAVREGA